MFWGVFAVDRELMFPAVLDRHYPAWLNHGVHTMPLVIGLLEVLLERHNYACNRLSLGLLLGFLATYLGWSVSTRHRRPWIWTPLLYFVDVTTGKVI